MNEPNDPLIGQTIEDRYLIQRRIGEGGMGMVYQAEHTRVRKRVAFKVLHKDMTQVPEAVARFQREAIVAAHVDDPHLVSALDFGTLDNGACYLVLDYIEGKVLRDELNDHGTVEIRRALRIASQMAKALAGAHEAGVTHRDLKPENIMLVERGDEHDFVKVFDFGMARLWLDSGPADLPPITKFGTLFGTPKYMAPEQVMQQGVDHRVDIYSLGIILYEMLAGAPPFDGDDMVAVLSRQVTEPPPPLPDTVPPRVRRLVMRLIDKDPISRVQTMSELYKKLQRLLKTWEPSRKELRSRSLRRRLQDWAMNLPSFRDALRTSAVALSAAVVMAAVLGGWFIFYAQDSVFSTVTRRPPVTDWASLRARSIAGDQQALAALDERPHAERKPSDWLALGHGWYKIGRLADALRAYNNAIALEPKYAEDPQLLRNLRRTADDPEAYEPVLRFTAELPGTAGPDLLFDLWSSTPYRNKMTILARKLLNSPAVKEKRSPALSIAIELRAAKQCEEFLKLLPRAKQHADTRSVRPLEKISEEEGCGHNHEEDCYPCVREGTLLLDALNAARRHPAFNFEG